MKRTLLLLLGLFILTTFQISFATTNSSNVDSLQDHNFVTPEQTWDQFKTAILKGDFNIARKCCSHGETKGVLKFEKMDDDKRKNIVLSMQELTKINQQENKAKYKLMRSSKGTHFYTYVYFEKINNEWKIKNY